MNILPDSLGTQTLGWELYIDGKKQERRRIEELHRLANSEGWRGQVFARIEMEEGDD